MEEIKQALYLKEQLDALRPIDKEQEARIMQKFRLDWNYHSNHLEGNSLTYGETKALILFGITAQGKPLKDTLEITGHNEAINWVLEMVKGEQVLTENFIRELHSLLLKDSYKDSKNAEGKIVPRKISAGKYKTTPNHVETVTGEIFYFASPEETPAKMFDLLTWHKEKIEEKEVNPIFLAAEFHYKFIRIHPFDDGNGRTARILMNFILMQFGFPPVIIKTEDKANYFAALQFADAGNIEPFITYIAQNLNRSLQIMIAGANGEEIEDDDDLDKEIALLEQRLNTFEDSEKPTKSKDSEKPTKSKQEITNCIKKFIIIIPNVLYKKGEKLRSLYHNSFITYLIKNKSDINLSSEQRKINDNSVKGGNFIFLTGQISNETLYIEVLIKNQDFKKIGFENIEFSYYFKLIFYKSYYSIQVQSGYKVNINYGAFIDGNERDKIIKSELKRHKEFIEQKIAQKENNNP